MVVERKRTQKNAEHLALEIKWLSKMINYRLQNYFNGEANGENETLIVPEPPIFEGEASVYSRFLEQNEFSIYERLFLILSFVPVINPAALDAFFVKDKEKGKSFTCFGGAVNTGHSGFLPTGETAMFIAAGNDLNLRFSLLDLFSGDHLFSKHGVLTLESANNNDPFLSGVLTPGREYIDLFTTGDSRKPTFGKSFPAKEITTKYEWDDLVLDYRTQREINELKIWINHGQTVMEDWGLGRKLKPGYLALFYGPPGTGKTLTAMLVSKLINKPLFRIDLSMIVSKFIGETEKNLSNVFDQAENKDWILFFDEADALFGKRTKVSDAHDRYANQEVSFLLQRIEDFSGLVILASNLKNNMDEAFTRRFQSTIYFPMPSAEERYTLWEKSFSEKSTLEQDIDLEEIANRFEITGGAIMNVVRYCSLLTVSRGSNVIEKADLLEGIRREFRKDGKLV